MARFPVLGFTEAELGFVLAALFIAIAGYEIVATGRETAKGEALGDSLGVARDSVESLRIEKRRLDSLLSLRSAFTPSCRERGEAENLIARITILDALTFQLDGARMDASGVRRRLAQFLDISRQKDCRFYIDLEPAPGVDGKTTMQARELFRRDFYFWR